MYKGHLSRENYKSMLIRIKETPHWVGPTDWQPPEDFPNEFTYNMAINPGDMQYFSSVKDWKEYMKYMFHQGMIGFSDYNYYLNNYLGVAKKHIKTKKASEV